MTKKERDKLIYSRYCEGYSQTEIGKFFGLSQSAVSLIVLAMKKGIVADKKETRGAKPKLSGADMVKLSRLLRSGWAEEGFSGWNKRSVKALISREFGVDYHENYIFELMRKIGHTSQLPAKKDYRQDPDKVSHFKNVQVVEIKKNEKGRT